MDPNPEIQKMQPATTDIQSSEASTQPKSSIDQIKRTLLDPRSISKKYDQAGRNDKALAIKGERQDSRTLRNNIGTNEGLAAQIDQQAAFLAELRGNKNAALIERMDSALARAKRLIKIKDRPAVELEGEVASLDTEIDTLSGQSSEAKVELVKLKQREGELPDPKKTLEAYYEKMETVPLTNEEKREYLKPEVLAQLSTEEYISLWRRLNPHFLSHVTRQGFRDHYYEMSHSIGLMEFHNGLVQILADNKMLRPSITIGSGQEPFNTAEINDFLASRDVLKAPNENEARKKLDNLFSNYPWYPNISSVHFANQDVPNDRYGAETGNEAFCLFPFDALASQYDFAINTKINDFYLWPKTLESGIHVDSGFVFLPENTPVDPNSGSKYASETKVIDGKEKRVMIEDGKLVSTFADWADQLTSDSPVIKAYQEYSDRTGPREVNRVDIRREILNVFIKTITDLGFSDEAAQSITKHLLGGVDGISQFQKNGKLGFGDSKKDIAIRQLREANANWKRSENPITAREYWERYFTQHPDQTPRHIIYYDGDPTTAVYKFQQQNNIGQADTSPADGPLLGFDDNHVADMHEDPRANAGYDELVTTANKIISDHYNPKTT